MVREFQKLGDTFIINLMKFTRVSCVERKYRSYKDREAGVLTRPLLPNLPRGNNVAKIRALFSHREEFGCLLGSHLLIEWHDFDVVYKLDLKFQECFKFSWLLSSTLLNF